MTMQEIDRRRAILGQAREVNKHYDRRYEGWPDEVAERWKLMLDAEASVEEALREWWKQDCKELS
jgi:hypothetical protein